ncbi:hypothetical protein D3C77_553050 [compost metagenome]
MAAYHQIAALDPGDIDARRYRAAYLRADLLEPGAVLVLAGQFVKVIPDVLAGQGGGGQQHQKDPQQAFAPVGLGFLPVQLERVVDQVEQRLFARGPAGHRAKSGLVAFVLVVRQLIQVVIRLFRRQTLYRGLVDLRRYRVRVMRYVVQIIIQYIRG